MADCIKLEGGPFFNDRMKGLEGMASLYKKRYCHDGFADCARWRVAQAGVAVPVDLFPNQKERAEAILAENASS
jgi:hypothetical protein